MTGKSTGNVHSHIPVGGASRLGGMVEVVIKRGAFQMGKAFPDRLFRLAADPETEGFSLPADQLEDPAGDKLTLTARISCDYDCLDVASLKQGCDVVKLFL